MFDLKSFIGFWLYDPGNPLLFTSKGFLLLFAVFLLIFNLLKKNFSARVLYVTAFSVYFYYLSSGLYFWLLVLMSVTDYSLGFFISRTVTKGRRKMLLALSLTIDLGLLCYFKYTNFFLEMLQPLISDEPFTARNIFLPVGVSFFTFQSLSYVIDIYRGKLEPTQKWIDYIFYLSFFPQLVAGPIVRAKDFIPQIYRKPFPNGKMFNYGFMLILIGLCKKIMVSDYISVNYVDRVFDNPLLYSGFENLMAIYGYAIQIYCDFSGYSDIAIGLALLLGFRFPENFHLPYQSATITDFWHRWHISLSTWLKDYLYISLGGNRKGKFRMYLNLLITMLLGGLWHGAAIRFIIWGGLHGLALCLHKLAMSIFPGMKVCGEDMTPWRRFLSTLVTFNFVCFCWIFFRAGDMQTVRDILHQVGTSMQWEMIPTFIASYWKVFLIILIAYVMHFIPFTSHENMKQAVFRLPIAIKILLSVAVIYIALLFQGGDVQPFIYFQF